MRAKANRVLPRECTGHSKHPLPKTQEKTLHLLTSPDSQHQNQIDYILCSQRWRSSIQSAKTRPGSDYGSDHELLIAKSSLFILQDLGSLIEAGPLLVEMWSPNHWPAKEFLMLVLLNMSTVANLDRKILCCAGLSLYCIDL